MTQRELQTMLSKQYNTALLVVLIAFSGGGFGLPACTTRSALVLAEEREASPKLVGRDEPLKLRRTLKPKDGNIRWIAFSPDGETLATLARDSLKLWKMEQLKRTK